jgi:hypothetical protein
MKTSNSKTIKTVAGSPWITHVKAYKKEFSVSFKDALKLAGATYTRKITSAVKKDKSTYKKNPWMEHIAKWKIAHPDWKTTMSYKDVLIASKDTYTRLSTPSE